jgi:tungstate transport system permease protein
VNDLAGGAADGFRLLLGGDPETWGTVGRSLAVSLAATLTALLLGLPLGVALGMWRGGPARTAAVGAVHAGMGLPPVVAGLLVSLLLWRSGPLGWLGLMFTPTAMAIAQALIATPLVAGLTAAAVRGLDPRFRLQLRAMGAGRVRTAWLLLREARAPAVAAVVAAFGAVISEVGAAMMVGGNIKGQTRVLTTATVLEVGRGNFAAAVALSTVLLVVVYAVVLALTLLQDRR